MSLQEGQRARGDLRLAPATSEADLAAVRQLCWDYRTFLLHNSEIDRDITETFYPEEKYARLMEGLAREHARPDGIILLARDSDGGALGCGMSHRIDAESSEIKRVFVTEAARGQGLARRLCRALMDQARADGYSRVLLDTSRTLSAAQALYLSLGFASRGPYQEVPEVMLPNLLFFEARL